MSAESTFAKSHQDESTHCEAFLPAPWRRHLEKPQALPNFIYKVVNLKSFRKTLEGSEEH